MSTVHTWLKCNIVMDIIILILCYTTVLFIQGVLRYNIFLLNSFRILLPHWRATLIKLYFPKYNFLTYKNKNLIFEWIFKSGITLFFVCLPYKNFDFLNHINVFIRLRAFLSNGRRWLEEYYTYLPNSCLTTFILNRIETF